MKRSATAIAAISAAILLAGPGGAAAPKLYAQELADQLIAQDHGVKSVAMVVVPPGASKPQVVAGAGAASADMLASGAEAVLKFGRETASVDRATHLLTADLVLRDTSARPVGALALTLTAPAGKAVAMKHAYAVVHDLARHISYLKNLLEPALYDPNLSYDTYGQHLIERELRLHPNVLILAMHVATPKNTDPEIIASSIGRIGKKADSDDLRLIKTGIPNLEVNETGDRFEDELILRDVSGDQIGAVGIVFPYKNGDDKAALTKQATAIRDELARRITTAANLVEPYPYASLNDNTNAQHLVDSELARRPDVLILALHVTPPGGSKNLIVGSSIGRIGKVADDDDMRVVNTGKPNLEVNKAGNRFEVESALLDEAGRRIGAISVVYAYKPGDDKAALQKKADAVDADIARRIPTRDSLFRSRW